MVNLAWGLGQFCDCRSFALKAINNDNDHTKPHGNHTKSGCMLLRSLAFQPAPFKGRLLLQNNNYAQANTPSWSYWTPKPQAIRMYGEQLQDGLTILLHPSTCLGQTTLPYQSHTKGELVFQYGQQQRAGAGPICRAPIYGLPIHRAPVYRGSPYT